MRFTAVFCVLPWAFVAPLVAAEVKKEVWAEGAASAAEAFARYAPGRIGVLLVATGKDPDLDFRYAGRALHTEEREFSYSFHRMTRWYELQLYEALRGVFQEKGYEVRCLNRGPWKGLRLKEVMAQAKGIDAACVVHYGIKRTHAVVNRDGYTWWVPFEGMLLKVKCTVFDVSSRDPFYELKGETLGTEDLYPNLGEMVVEEPLYPSGYSPHGGISNYKIAIYHTSVRDPKTGKRTLPMIRTSEGSLDISYEGNLGEAGQQITKKDPVTGMVILKDKKIREDSVLGRLLQHVTYRPKQDEIEYFDLVSIHRCSEMVREKIPQQRP